jgi:hypothetical protein
VTSRNGNPGTRVSPNSFSYGLSALHPRFSCNAAGIDNAAFNVTATASITGGFLVSFDF